MTQKCFPGLTYASKITVICQDLVKKNYTLLAQYCGPDENCRTMNQPGVLLEKASMCLTITNSSYDSWCCEIKAFVKDKLQGPERFIINVLNLYTSISPSLGNNDSHSGTIAAVVCVLIICVLIIGLIFFILYKKRKLHKEQDIEKGEEENSL